MPIKSKKQSLTQLQKLWDKKLADSGFVDIENRRTGALKTRIGSPLSESNNGLYSIRGGYTSRAWKVSQIEYYRRANQLLHTAVFKSSKHRRIWELHCQGLTLKVIAKKLHLTERQIKYAVHVMKLRFELSLTTNREATDGSNHESGKQTNSNT